MRATHVITRLIVGGAQENTIASVLGLHRKPDLQVNLISGPSLGREGSLESCFADSPELLTILPELVRPIHPWKDCLAWRRLVQIFRAQPPRIVHTHSGKAGVLGRFAAARAGVPVIVHTIHGPSFGAFQGPAANFIFRSAERRAAAITSHFVTVADAMRDQYLAAGIGRPQLFTRVFSGFPLEPFLSATNDPALRARWGIGPEDIVIGKIGRLFKLKGHEDLFRIAPALLKHHPKLKFLLVGDGPWRHRFEQHVQALGLEKHFIFTGLVPPAEVPRLIGIMDLVAHLSLREGLPRALPQALAVARPVVAYDCDGAREVCLDGKTGFLIPPGDLASLTTALDRLAGDASLREQLGRQGRQFVTERFPVERMVDDLYALYMKLAAHQRPAIA
ncbi:MAG: glycosyl transferase group 1 [Pedosphaera sp.]|nr:glycosyl transferase group 1 [Pedosphaera sp.]